MTASDTLCGRTVKPHNAGKSPWVPSSLLCQSPERTCWACWQNVGPGGKGRARGLQLVHDSPKGRASFSPHKSLDDVVLVHLELLFHVLHGVRVRDVRGILRDHAPFADLLLVLLPVGLGLTDDALRREEQQLDVVLVSAVLRLLLAQQRRHGRQGDARPLRVRRREEVRRELLVWLARLVAGKMIEDPQVKQAMPVVWHIPEVEDRLNHRVVSRASSGSGKLGGIDAISLAAAHPAEVAVHVQASHLLDPQELVHLPISETTSALEDDLAFNLPSTLQVQRVIGNALDLINSDLHKAVGLRQEIDIAYAEASLLHNGSMSSRGV
mmetsp:Transcript_78475/g.230151  ORF Transcript_78475/g.230151 Transcript_78475/m.230151 type:complete len:325 (+) Transcript_78475:294-1268(+)